MGNKTYYIDARRWFNNREGNTYHTVKIFKGTELIWESDITYGYENHFLQTAKKAFPDLISYGPNANATITVTDVNRKKDLL